MRSPRYMVPALERKSEPTMEAAMRASPEKKREVLSVMSAATKRQEQALTRERSGDSLASSRDGARVLASSCRLLYV